jgi:hypothetical protein
MLLELELPSEAGLPVTQRRVIIPVTDPKFPWVFHVTPECDYQQLDNGKRKYLREATRPSHCLNCGKRAKAVCKGCRVAFFCDATCQKQAWGDDHKKMCGIFAKCRENAQAEYQYADSLYDKREDSK